MLPKIRKLEAWASVIAAAVVVLAACGNDEPVASAGPTDRSIAESLPTAAPVAATAPVAPTSTGLTPAAPVTVTPERATPTATATPTPSPTSVPSAVPAQSAVASVSEPNPSASASIAALSESAWASLTALTEGYSPRESATDQEKAAADYLVARFAELGYRARIQPFSFEALSGQSRSLSLSAAEIGEVVVAPMRLSGEGQVSGVLVAVGLATAGDVEEVDLDGKVALIQRGTISFQVKARRVAEAGAVAAVIYNNGPAMFGGNLREQASIPVVSISGTDGETIKKRMAEGEVRATVNVTTEVYQSRNVVAEKGPSTGSGRPAPGTESEQVVVLGGHFDTVADVLGAGDNGSGVATLLALARELSTRDYPFALRFVAFGSEEMGLHGSSHYVDTLPQAELERIVAMLNFDALGTGKTQVLGTPELRELAVDFADANGIDIAVLLSLDGFGSDHAPFAAADIPHLSFFSDDFSRIHTQQDTLEFVQPQLMGVAAFLGLAMLDLLAWS